MLTDRLEFSQLQELAERGTQEQFRLSADQLPRLKLVLVADQPGEIELQVGFSAAADGHPLLHITLAGQLGLVCQRCLHRMEWALDLATQLDLLASEADVETLVDPFDSVVVDEQGLQLLSVVEDEILSALPISAMHKSKQECGPQSLEDYAAAPTDRPFAQLAELMQGSGKVGSKN
jgi:uncharacterized protein